MSEKNIKQIEQKTKEMLEQKRFIASAVTAKILPDSTIVMVNIKIQNDIIPGVEGKIHDAENYGIYPKGLIEKIQKKQFELLKEKLKQLILQEFRADCIISITPEWNWRYLGNYA